MYDPTLPNAPGGRLTKSLAIDYVGLSGIRVQIETLLDDLKEINAQLELTTDTLDEYRNQVKIDMENLNVNHHEVNYSNFPFSLSTHLLTYSHRKSSVWLVKIFVSKALSTNYQPKE